MRKKAKAKLLEDMCLHCEFFRRHEDKWPGWRVGDNVDPRAFNDLVRSAIQIVAEIFSMMDEADRMRFFQNVEHTLNLHEGRSNSDKTLQTLREVLEKLGTLDTKIVKH